MADETEREEIIELTNADWGKIHAKAWREPAFKTKLEEDPTAAVREYFGQKLQRSVTSLRIKMVTLRPAPHPDDVPPEFWEDVNPFPPSCC